MSGKKIKVHKKDMAVGAGLTFIKAGIVDPVLELFGVIEGTVLDENVSGYKSVKKQENLLAGKIDIFFERFTDTAAYKAGKEIGTRKGHTCANFLYQAIHRAGTWLLRNISIIIDMWANTSRKEQYNSNCAKEMEQLHMDAAGNEKWEPITNQESLTYLDFGPVTASYSACEAIAVYNGVIKTGQKILLSDVLCQARRLNAVMLSGAFGVAPYKIGRLLSHYGLEYEIISSRAGLLLHNQPGEQMIVSMWNHAYNIRRQLHTFLIEADGNGTYTSYNRISSPKPYQSETLHDIMDGGRFVFGYSVKASQTDPLPAGPG